MALSYVDKLPLGTYYISIAVMTQGEYKETETGREKRGDEYVFMLLKQGSATAPKGLDMSPLSVTDIAGAPQKVSSEGKAL